MKKFLAKITPTTIILIVIFSIGSFLLGVNEGIRFINKRNDEKLVDYNKDNKSNPDSYSSSVEDQRVKELIERLKVSAVQTNYNNILTGEWEDKGVYAIGVVSSVDVVSKADNINIPTFNIMAEEGDKYGIYSIFNTRDNINIKDGDKVKVYGFVDGTDSMGVLKISAPYIEKL